MTTPIFPTGPGALPPQPEEVTCGSFKSHLREIAGAFDSGRVDVHDVHFTLRVVDQMAEALKASPNTQNRQMAESWIQSDAGKMNRRLHISSPHSITLLDWKCQSRLILDWLAEQV